jgi:hypothetical protein
MPNKEEPISLGNLATIATAGLAVAGALWFGLLSLGAAIAYGAVGVHPREVGLSSGTVVVQSAIGLTIAILVLSLVQVVAALFERVRTSHNAKPATAAKPFSSISFLVKGGLILLVVALVFVIAEAWRARVILRDGHRTTSIAPTGLPSPWGGQVADLAWAGGSLPIDPFYRPVRFTWVRRVARLSSTTPRRKKSGGCRTRR